MNDCIKYLEFIFATIKINQGKKYLEIRSQKYSVLKSAFVHSALGLFPLTSVCDSDLGEVAASLQLVGKTRATRAVQLED